MKHHHSYFQREKYVFGQLPNQVLTPPAMLALSQLKEDNSKSQHRNCLRQIWNENKEQGL